MRWSASSSRDIAPEAARNLGRRRFKGRDELLTFAAKRPGALSGHFLCMVYEKMHNKLPRDVRELRRTKLTEWVQKYSGLSEARDVREVSTLAAAIDSISRGELHVVMDLLCQRILSIQAAKAVKGGSWEKAQNLELLAKDATSGVPSGMLRLLA